MRIMPSLLATASFAVTAVALLSSPVRAQAVEGGTEDIIVTATKRDASLQDIPFSINAQTAEMLQRSGAGTIEDISRSVAGLTVQNLGPGQSQVTIRGVSAGQIVRDQPGVKEQVGIYLDESAISLSLFTPDIDLFDLNRVETLRGPQGTLFGAGSIGGTIRYITEQPSTDRLSGMVEGNVNMVEEDAFGWHLKGAINVPLSDKIAARAVGYYTRFGGFIDALGEGGTRSNNINDGERYGGRLSVAFMPTEDITITPRIVYQKATADGFNRQEVYNVFANPNTTTRPAIQLGEREQYLLLPEAFEDEFLLADLTASIGFGAVTLTSVTSYVDRDILVSRDASALTGSVSVDLGFPAAAVLLPSNLRDTTKLEQITQEVRLSSDYDGPVQWVIGGFYSDVDRTYAQRLPTPGYDAFTDSVLGAGTSAAVANGFPANSPYNADIPFQLTQKALFGEASYEFGKLTATAGLRWYDFSEERRFVSGGLFANGDDQRDRTSSNGFNPRFLLSYKPNEDLTINAQASKGFRLGGVNDPLNIPLCAGGATGIDAQTYGNRPTFDDETLWNYEAGIRARGPSGLRFAAAAFYTDIRNLQVTADAGSCSSRVIFNVPKAHSMGIEAEVSIEPVKGFTLSAAGSLIEARFDSDVRTAAGAVIAGIQDGNRLPTVPEFQFAATATYEHEFAGGTNGYASATVQHVGDRFTQPGDQVNNPRSFVSGLPFGGATGTVPTVVDLRLPAYTLVNLSAGVRLTSGTDISIYANNLFDENPLLSFDRERGGRARLGFNVGQPRTIGLTVRQAF
jgi:iron complex outermembrane receptor protein